jgi:hypothetical protein
MDEVWALIKINDDQKKAWEWLDDGLGLLSESFFGFEFIQELESLFFWIEEKFTCEGDDNLLDDFKELDGVDFLLEFFDELSVKVESNFALDLGVEQEREDCDW